MTTYQGIAAVTQTLSYLVGNAVRSVLPEATVTLSPPEVQPAAARDVPRLNIYLVQVLPEPTMRSADLPMRARQRPADHAAAGGAEAPVPLLFLRPDG